MPPKRPSTLLNWPSIIMCHDVMTWKRCPHYWPFVQGIQNPSVTGGFPLQKASNVKLWYFSRYPGQALVRTIQLSVIWNTITLMWRHRNALGYQKLKMTGHRYFLLCFVVVRYSSILLISFTFTLLAPWRIRVDSSQKSAKPNNESVRKQSTTKPCA